MPPRVVALISTFNEEDILAEVLEHLCAEGISPYVIDDGSTDGTKAILDAFAGRGLIEYEATSTERNVFRWTDILRRKEMLAGQLHADWFIHHDADEFRESPWSGLTLAEAIGIVDANGFNAIDFALMAFWPMRGHVNRVLDIRSRLTHFAPVDEWNRRQIKCWKNQKQPVDLVTSGGHEASLHGRRVFPMRFLLRHYPIRSEEHGRRKVLKERLPRFDPAEKALGWHIQYDQMAATGFERNPDTLTPFDSLRTRVALTVEDVVTLDAVRSELTAENTRLQTEGSFLHAQLATQLERIGELLRDVETLSAESPAHAGELEQRRRDAESEVSRVGGLLAEEMARARELQLTFERRLRRVEGLLEAETSRTRDMQAQMDVETTRHAQILAAQSAQWNETEAALRSEATHERELRLLHVGQLEQRLAIIGSELSTANEGVLTLAAEVEAFRISRTWRWTQPVRHLIDMLSGGKRIR